MSYVRRFCIEFYPAVKENTSEMERTYMSLEIPFVKKLTVNNRPRKQRAPHVNIWNIEITFHCNCKPRSSASTNKSRLFELPLKQVRIMYSSKY